MFDVLLRCVFRGVNLQLRAIIVNHNKSVSCRFDPIVVAHSQRIRPIRLICPPQENWRETRTRAARRI
jgi:hypothetical protein